jgi:hypothetical protein
MKSTLSTALAVILALFLGVAGCAEGGRTDVQEGPTGLNENEKETSIMMQMKINDTPVTVAWEDNESVRALMALAADGLTIQMSMFGGFEQVGPIGQSLPSADQQTVTASGDIVLYSSDQIVVFYGSNSWAYTRLGHITDQSAEQMRALLGNGAVQITLTME